MEPGAAGANPDDFQWELYHVAKDFSQSEDLAALNPAKLKELKAIFDREAKKYQVYPLDATFAERGDVRLRPSLSRDREVFTYYPGAIRIPEGTAPDTKNRSFVVTAEIEIGEAPAEGVLITQGGRFGGWGLLMRAGKPEFNYAFSNQKEHKYRIAASDGLPPGKHTLRFEFQYDGAGYGKGGTGKLVVDGKTVAEGLIERTIPVRYSLDETMDIGEDTGTPVVEDYLEQMPFRFNGDLEKVVIELGKSGISSNQKAEREENARRVVAIEE